MKLICGAQSSGSQAGAVPTSGEHLVVMSGDVSDCHHRKGGSCWHLEAGGQVAAEQSYEDQDKPLPREDSLAPKSTVPSVRNPGVV